MRNWTMSEVSKNVREMFQKGDDIRDAGLTTPEDVLRYDDIVYGKDTTWQVMDLYRPKAAGDQTLPVIVSFHGGGWVYGDKERYQYYCMNLAQQGFAVVNFTYRLAPEFKFPAPLVDANLVFCWIMEHSREYHLDTDQIFAVGDSAGAHGLALYSCLIGNADYRHSFAHYASDSFLEKFHKDYEGDVEVAWGDLQGEALLEAINCGDFTTIDTEGFHLPEGLNIRALGLNCGKYAMEVGDNPMTGLDMMAEYLPEHVTEWELDMVYVLHHLTEAFPPSYVLTAPKDFLKEEAPLMAKALTERDINNVYRMYADPEKELGHVFHCNMKLEHAAKVNREECAFFKEFINR